MDERCHVESAEQIESDSLQIRRQDVANFCLDVVSEGGLLLEEFFYADEEGPDKRAVVEIIPSGEDWTIRATKAKLFVVDRLDLDPCCYLLRIQSGHTMVHKLDDRGHNTISFDDEIERKRTTALLVGLADSRLNGQKTSFWKKSGRFLGQD